MSSRDDVDRYLASMSSLERAEHHIFMIEELVAALNTGGSHINRAEAVLTALYRAVLVEESLREAAMGLGLRPDTDGLRERLRRPAKKAHQRPHLVIDNTKD